MIDGSPVVVETDHKPIIHLTTMKEPSRRQWRWITYINEFDVIFEYIKGKENVIADMLSRIPSSSNTVSLLTTEPAISTDTLVKLQKSDQDIEDLVKGG